MSTSGEVSGSGLLLHVARLLASGDPADLDSLAACLGRDLGCEMVILAGGPRLDDLDAVDQPVGCWSSHAGPVDACLATARLLVPLDGTEGTQLRRGDPEAEHWPAGLSRQLELVVVRTTFDCALGKASVLLAVVYAPAELAKTAGQIDQILEAVAELLRLQRSAMAANAVADLAFNRSPNPMSIRDAAYRLVLANTEWEELYGTALAEAIGTVPSAFGATGWREDALLARLIDGEVDSLERDFLLRRGCGSEFRGRIAVFGADQTGPNGRASVSHVLDMSAIDAARDEAERRQRMSDAFALVAARLSEFTEYSHGVELAVSELGAAIGYEIVAACELTESGHAEIVTATKGAELVTGRVSDFVVTNNPLPHETDIDPEAIAIWIGSLLGRRVSASISELVINGRVRGFVAGMSDTAQRSNASPAALSGLAGLLVQFRSRLESERIATHVYKGAPIAISVRDSQLRMVACNAEYEKLLGFTESELLGTAPEFLVHRRHREEAAPDVIRLAAGADEVLVYRTADGGRRLCRTLIRNVSGSNDEHLVVSFLEDVTEQVSQAAELESSRQRFTTVTEQLGAAVLSLDRNLTICYASPSFDGLRPAIPAAEVVGHAIHEAAPAMPQEVSDAIVKVFETGERTEVEWPIRIGKTETWFMTRYAPEFADDGTVSTVVTMTFDNTDQHHVRNRLEHQARHDDLTGLANRSVLIERLDQLARDQGPSGDDGRVSEPAVALLLLDLDRFKVVNDSLGHAVGDQLLVVVADRLCQLTRRSDLVVRLGGDEFAILVDGPVSGLEAAALANRLNRLLSEPVRIGPHEIFTTASIGIAFPSSLDDEVDEIVRHADAAMYQSKERGPSNFSVFDDRLRDDVIRRMDIETALRRAPSNGELVLRFQPEIDLITGRVLGAEALVRWEHPTRGLLGPGEFIEIAEDTGAIVDLGAWVLNEACAVAGALHADPQIGDFMMRVNVSTRQLEQAHLVDEVMAALERGGVSPEQLCLEITETAIMGDIEKCLARLGVLHDLGVHLAVDDFGTGFSSLAYLKRLPVHILKIDRAFVDGLGSDEDDTMIVRSIVRLAESLGLGVVGEGVETPAQMHELVSLGCRRAQGFLLARPMERSELESLLRVGRIPLPAAIADLSQSHS